MGKHKESTGAYDLKIITRYVTREYLKMLAYSLMTFIVIYLIIDFFERIDMFIKYKTPTATIIRYFAFKVPFIVYQMLPIAVLLSTLLTMGILSKNNEVTAMKSGGMSLVRITTPILLIGLLITLFTFVGSEYVTPYTNMQVSRIKNNVKQKKARTFSKHNRIWYSGKDMIYNIDYFNAKTNTLHGVTVFNFDDEFNLLRRIDAAAGAYKAGEWFLFDVIERGFSHKSGRQEISRVTELDEKAINIPETPDSLKEVRKKAEEMSYNELKVFVAKVKEQGYEAAEYEVDLHAKVAIPFVCVIMTVIGIPFALKRQRAGSLAVGIGISIIIGFLYYITLSFALSLGHAGVLPPLIAAWVSLFIFLMIGGYMFSTVRQ